MRLAGVAVRLKRGEECWSLSKQEKGIRTSSYRDAQLKKHFFCLHTHVDTCQCILQVKYFFTGGQVINLNTDYFSRHLETKGRTSEKGSLEEQEHGERRKIFVCFGKKFLFVLSVCRLSWARYKPRLSAEDTGADGDNCGKHLPRGRGGNSWKSLENNHSFLLSTKIVCLFFEV